MTNTMLITNSRLEIKFGCISTKEILQGEGKKIKPIRYGPFKIMEKIGTNAFKLDLPPYMQIYYIVNVENLRFFEPPLIDDHGEHV